MRVKSYHRSWFSESLLWQNSTGYVGGRGNGKSYSFSGFGSVPAAGCIWAGESYNTSTAN